MGLAQGRRTRSPSKAERRNATARPSTRRQADAAQQAHPSTLRRAEPGERPAVDAIRAPAASCRPPGQRKPEFTVRNGSPLPSARGRVRRTAATCATCLRRCATPGRTTTATERGCGDRRGRSTATALCRAGTIDCEPAHRTAGSASLGIELHAAIFARGATMKHETRLQLAP